MSRSNVAPPGVSRASVCVVVFFLLCASLLSACASHNVDTWLASARHVEELDAPLPCGRVTSGLERFLREREKDKFFGGEFAYDGSHIEGECGRFILSKTFSSDIDALIVLVPLALDETKVVIYQRYADSFVRELAFAVEGLAAENR